jgi:PAS domain S-box-containing protein
MSDAEEAGRAEVEKRVPTVTRRARSLPPARESRSRDRSSSTAHPDTEVYRAQLAAIVDSSDDGIISKTLEGTITSWNRGAERLFGWSAEEAIGQHITLIIPADRLREEDDVIARIRSGARVDHFETVRRRKDGGLVDVSITVSPIRNADGAIVGASKVARDISERKKAEQERDEMLGREQAARAEAESANRGKDEFLATLSHELRTPLNAILGWTQVLSNARHEPGTVDRALETIARNAKQQARLIEDLLDLSRILGGKLRLDFQQVDLVAVLSAVLETLRLEANTKGVAIRTHFDPLVGTVSGDPERLQQIFRNLLGNAIKFTGHQGRVDLTLEQVQSRAVVTVSDTGIGIRPDMLPVIFERFRQADSSITRAHGGLGLGLAIVKQLTELHDGTVVAASPGEGYGATFTVTLPITSGRPPLAAPRELRHPDAARCEGIAVLLVDDDIDGRSVVRILLEQSGARVTAVGSASDGLSAFQKFRPDILISDLAMPGMDGYEFIRQVRTLSYGRRVPAIALTAHASADMRIKAFQAGFDMYVAKPVEPAELMMVVAALTRSRTETGALPPGQDT